MESKLKNTMCLTNKIVIHHKFKPLLDVLYNNCIIETEKMLKNRNLSSSKYYKLIPCVVAKSLISKYQKNKKCKKVNKLVIPICGDKGKQVKLTINGIRIPSLFKKEVLEIDLPKVIVGTIRHVEFFKRNSVWYMSYSYNVLKEEPIKTTTCVGVDRNSVGNVVTVAYGDKIKLIGPSAADINQNFKNRRRKLQKKGAKNALVKIKRKQSNRTKDINHKVSKEVVAIAKQHCSAIVLEDLKGISKKKSKVQGYVQKSQWSYFQLETFIKYKAALSGIPVIYISPRYTSQKCSKCGCLNKTSTKKYVCKACGHVAHRDANAAINIMRLGEETLSCNSVGHIDIPLNRTTNVVVESESSGGVR